MELDLPTPVSRPPSCRVGLSSHAVYPPKNTFASIKQPNWDKSLFYNKKLKSEKEFDKLTFGNIEFVEYEI
jgi:hypothetical protein